MSFYRKSSSELGDDSVFYSRKNQQTSIFDSDCNINGNNNTDSNDHNGKSRLISENGRRFSGRSRKSKLIETMAANFEKKSSESQSPRNNSSRHFTSNGDVKVTLTPTRIEPVPAILNNSESRLEDGEISPDDKKVSPSSKRGKSQRSRRMIRQKRRSTGVVNKEDLDELDQINSTEAEHNLQRQTDDNTQNNEVSPKLVSPPPRDRLSPALKTSTNSRKGSDPPSSDINQFSPRRQNGLLSPNEKNNTSIELKELRAKLDTAEITITRLRHEIKLMDQELHTLEDENEQLKKDNKMLDDENKTMLRIIRS